MKHPASRGLYAYWEERRGGRAAPERAEVEPSAIRQILSETFIVALDDSAGHPFRLAGTRLCALFGRELKGEFFLSLWAEPSRRSILGLLTILREELVGTVAGVTAEAADGGPIELELLLLPLAASRPKSRTHDRRPGAAAGRAMDRRASRHIDPREPAPHRVRTRTAAVATIPGATNTPRTGGLRRRPLLNTSTCAGMRSTTCRHRSG